MKDQNWKQSHWMECYSLKTNDLEVSGRMKKKWSDVRDVIIDFVPNPLLFKGMNHIDDDSGTQIKSTKSKEKVTKTTEMNKRFCTISTLNLTFAPDEKSEQHLECGCFSMSTNYALPFEVSIENWMQISKITVCSAVSNSSSTNVNNDLLLVNAIYHISHCRRQQQQQQQQLAR